MIGINMDITGQSQAEEALRQSEQHFRTMADNISQLAWMTDESGWIFWYNRRWFDYTGTTQEEMEGWGWQKVHHPDYVEKAVEKFSHCIIHQQPWEDIFPLRGKDGQYRWFLSRAIPIRDEKTGKIRHWFGTNTDISELKDAQETLKYQKSLLEAQQEVSPLAILVVSPEGKVLTYNQRFIEFWRLPQEVMDTQN
ncbi:MAG: PAS domain S-box protein [Bacteroidia bacterium]|nr:PAS domain S-box protein [Bacteroidia bacterium]